MFGLILKPVGNDVGEKLIQREIDFKKASPGQAQRAADAFQFLSEVRELGQMVS
jgi:hypothetical protein